MLFSTMMINDKIIYKLCNNEKYIVYIPIYMCVKSIGKFCRFVVTRMDSNLWL